MSAEVQGELLLRPSEGYFQDDPLPRFLLFTESSDYDIFLQLNDFAPTIGMLTVLSPPSMGIEWLVMAFTTICILVHVGEQSKSFLDFLATCSKVAIARNSDDEKRLNEAFGIHIKQSIYASKIQASVKAVERRAIEAIPPPKMIGNALTCQTLHDTLYFPFLECLIEQRIRNSEFCIPDDVTEFSTRDLSIIGVSKGKRDNLMVAFHKTFYLLVLVRTTQAKYFLLNTNYRGILRGMHLCKQNKTYWITYPYCTSFISREETLDDYQRLKICIDIAFAIDSLHNDGYLFGKETISEENIYIDYNGNGKLCDIGICARAEDKNTFSLRVREEVEEFCLLKNRILRIKTTNGNVHTVMSQVIYELVERCFIESSQALQIRKDIEWHLQMREEMPKNYIDIRVAEMKEHMSHKSKSLIDFREESAIFHSLYIAMYEDPELYVDYLELCVKSVIGVDMDLMVRLINMLEVVFVNPKLQTEYVMTKALSIIEQYIHDPQDAPGLYCHVGKAYIYGRYGKHRVPEGVKILRILGSYGVTDALITLSSFMRSRNEFEEAKCFAATVICCGEGAAGYFELGMNHKDMNSPFHDDEKAIEAFNLATEMGHMESELEILTLCQKAVPDRITSLARIAQEINYSGYGPLIDACIEEGQQELGKQYLRDLKAIVDFCDFLDNVKWRNIYCPDRWNLRTLREVLYENLHRKEKRWRTLNA